MRRIIISYLENRPQWHRDQHPYEVVLVDRHNDDGQSQLPSRDIVLSKIVWESGQIQCHEASNDSK